MLNKSESRIDPYDTPGRNRKCCRQKLDKNFPKLLEKLYVFFKKISTTSEMFKEFGKLTYKKKLLI